MPRVDDALSFLIEYLRDNPLGQYGYDLYIPNVCRNYAQNVEGFATHDNALEQRIVPLSGVFYEAAWELCRRGIIRPGVRNHRQQVTEGGSGGDGYSLTTIGRTWLADTEHSVFIPTEPARVAELIARFRDKFGEGFFQRAQEAIKCHSATTYLASCVMCGAAAESILLHLAIQKNGSEEAVLAIYQAPRGRSRTEDLVLNGVPQRLATTFRNLTDLLKYWRDDASHGVATEISEFEAYEALARLLRFAHFATDHLEELTTGDIE